MAITVNTDMKIYDTLAQTAYIERVQDVIEVFNGNSNGAIVLDSQLIAGDFSKNAFYEVPGSVTHRNVNSTSDVTPTAIASEEMVGVKCPWKFGPYATTDEAFKRRARSPEEFYELVGQAMADKSIEYQIESAVASLTGAIGSNAAMLETGAIATDHKKVLTKAMRKFGDRFSRISTWVMDSSTYLDIVDDAIDEKIFEEAGVVVYGGVAGTMGKPVLVTDKAPADKVFGLQAGAVRLTESQAPGTSSYPITGKENMANGFQAEGTFNCEVLGYKYLETAGENPDNATLGAAASWSKYAASNKATAGVILTLI